MLNGSNGRPSYEPFTTATATASTDTHCKE
jgi:hypothetical protein